MLDFEEFIIEADDAPRRSRKGRLLRHAQDHEKLARAAERALRYGTRHLKPNTMRDDPEIGFIPAIAAAIPMVANLAGSLLGGIGGGGKGGGGGDNSAAAAKAQDVLNVLTNAIGGDKAAGEDSIKEVVANIVRTIPSPVVNEVKKAISELKNKDKAEVAARDLLVNKVDGKFAPQLNALLAGLKASQLQAQATHEHNTLKAENQFRANMMDGMQQIANRLVLLEKRLGSSAIVRGDTRINILGGRSLLERG